METNQFSVALAVGLAFMLIGYYALRRLQLRVVTRVAIGLAMLALGALLLYTWPGDIFANSLVAGLTIALVGLGINQAATPFRLAMRAQP